MIADRSFAADGSFRYPSAPEGGVTDAYMNGVLGDVILVNGAPWPAQVWNAILPLTHYLHLQMDETMGVAMRPVLVEAGALLLYPLIAGGLALWLIGRAGRRA